MPVVPQDTTATNLSDAVNGKPKEQSDGQQKLATLQEYHAQPGPELSGLRKLGEPASKEELKKRAEELNKGN